MGDASRNFLCHPVIDDYRMRAPESGRMVGGRRTCSGRTGARRDVVSVITVTFNSLDSIERTIRSVVNQSYANLEYILIDGGSKDGTLDVLRNWSKWIDLWVSEGDSGISDAFNKGISLATGEFVMIVNSDDWLEADHLKVAVDALRSCDADYIFGDLIIHDPDGRIIGSFRGEAGYAKRIAHTMPFINHPTVVCRRNAYVRHGLFNTDLHHAMDYEWFLRVAKQGGRGVYVANLSSHMTLNGRSDRFFSRSLAEVRDVSIAYGYPATLARMRFLARLLKGNARRSIERLLPEPACKLLRRTFNQSFVPP